METFIEALDLVANPDFHQQRENSLRTLKDAEIDPPLTNLMNDLSGLTCCFSLQSCYGHFLYPGQSDSHFIGPLPVIGEGVEIEYRIAYLALCIEDSDDGRDLKAQLRQIAQIAPSMIQFGSATWFWDRQINSYALQVEPDRFKDSDKAYIGYKEALEVEVARSQFFGALGRVIENFGSSG